MKGYCEICGTEIDVRVCCSGHECGCMGMPVDPPVCSDKCYDEFMTKPNVKDTKGIFLPDFKLTIK